MIRLGNYTIILFVQVPVDP